MEKSEFNRKWITKNAVEIISQYDRGVLTLRGLHYRLVAAGMTNDTLHYKKVVAAMIKSRWEGVVGFGAFSDHDREMVGDTQWQKTVLEESIEMGKEEILGWMEYYTKNRWENQPYYPEIFIEKKALQGVFKPVCDRWRVALGPCKGYPSLTFLYKAMLRFSEAINMGKDPIILYFGDYDPSGEDIPRSIRDNFLRMGVNVEVKRIALMQQQVLDWGLPPAPVKLTDSRTGRWDGLGQVELDAVEPEQLQKLCQDAIIGIFDSLLHKDLVEEQKEEKVLYKEALKQFIKTV